MLRGRLGQLEDEAGKYKDHPLAGEVIELIALASKQDRLIMTMVDMLEDPEDYDDIYGTYCRYCGCKDSKNGVLQHEESCVWVEAVVPFLERLAKERKSKGG